MIAGDVVRIKRESKHFALDAHELQAGMLVEIIDTTQSRLKHPIGRVLFGARREIYPLSMLERATLNNDGDIA